MTAIDTNILVYAHRRDSDWFAPASAAVKMLAESGEIWAIPWPCIHEFFAIVTSPRIYNPPSTIPQALEQVAIWMESPTLRLIGEMKEHWQELSRIIAAGKIRGAMVHDARIAAICKEHGIRALWTVDRDFSRMGVRTVNPLHAG